MTAPMLTFALIASAGGIIAASYGSRTGAMVFALAIVGVAGLGVM